MINLRKDRFPGPETALSVVNTGGGEGVRGTTNSDTNAAVVGMSNGSARAGHFQSVGGEGVRGTTNSDTNAAVVGMSNGSARAGHFQSVGGEGVRGTTNSDTNAAVVGVSNGRAPAGFFQGIVQVTDDIQLLNADCAEDFDIVESEENVEAGTVMVLNELGSLQPSYQEYDKKVAGIVSGASGYKPAIVLDRQQSQNNKGRLPVALMGKTYCKVDARHCSIEIGDLLTTSSTKGYAMKAEEPMKAFGAVIGKALGSIKGRIGMIPVLVTLQ